MARLEIEQIRAPDLSVASQAMARSGDSFREGMSSASDLLGKYQEGLESSGDAELTNMLAQANNADEWDAIVANTDFNSMNLSAAMRETVINRTGTMLGFDQSRADIRGTDAQTGNTNATAARTRNNTQLDTNADTRMQTSFNRNIAVEDQRADIAGQIARADEFGRTNGLAGNSGLAPENVSGLLQQGSNAGPRADGSGMRPASSQNYSANVGNVMNSQFQSSFGTSPEVADTLTQAFLMNFQDESGMNGTIVEGEDNVHGTRGKGYYQLTGSRRDDFEAIYGTGDEAYSDENQMENMMRELGGPESAAFQRILEAAETGDAGATAAAIVSNFLRPAQEHEDRRVGEYTSGSRSAAPIPPSRQPVMQNPNRSTDANGRNALLDTFSSPGNLLPYSEVQGIMNGQYGMAQTGQDAISAADQTSSDQFQAEQLLAAARNNVDPTAAILEAQNSGQESDPVRELQRRNNIIGAAAEGGIFDSTRLQIGTTGIASEDNQIASQTLDNIQETQNRDRFQFTQNAAVEFKENPVQSLTVAMDQLDIPTTPAVLESAINTLAEKAGISREEAAYSFARAAEEDTSFVPDWSLGGDNLSQNRAYEFAVDNFTGDKAETARQTRRDTQRIVERIETVTTNLGRIERNIQKMRQQGQTVPNYLTTQRTDARTQLKELYEQNRPKAPQTTQEVTNPQNGLGGMRFN